MLFVVYLYPNMRQIFILIIISLLGSFTQIYAQSNQPNQSKPKYNEFGQRIRYDQFGNELDQFGNPIDPSTRPDSLEKDSNQAEVKALPPKLYMWKISEQLGNIKAVNADTLYNYFQNSNLDDGLKGNYNHIGNLGAPRFSRYYFDRQQDIEDVPFFLQPFSTFYFKPSQFFFTNSNVPYTNLTYHSSGNKINGDDRFKAYFSVNANSKLAFGFNIDYLYGRGYYQHQSTSFFNGGVFGSYHGEKYQAHLMYNNFVMKMAENGGITDDRYITNPDDMSEGNQNFETQNIPVYLTRTWNRNNNFYIHFNHRYNLGFTKDVTRIVPNEEVENLNDTIVTSKYIPVTSIIHTFKIQRGIHKFIGKDEPADYYDETFINKNENFSNDRTTSIAYENTIGLALNEGVNKYVPMGLTVFLNSKISKFDLMSKDPTKTKTYNQNELYIGGELSKQNSNIFTYKVLAQTGISKHYTGNFKLRGDIGLNIPIKQDTISLKGFAEITNKRSSFFMRHFHSNHYYWDAGKNGMDNFKTVFSQKVGGTLGYNRTKTFIKFGFENIKDYVYYGPNVVPIQHGENIQIMSASLSQDFKFGILHLDNEVTWQKSSNNSVIPLPSVTLYHNLYIQTSLAKKVLKVQLGADVRYFTKYNAPAYNPVLQNFHIQPENTEVAVGAYPVINVYANLHLKRTRIYAMLSHVNQGMGNNRAFYIPHYPINPRLFKIGISWNFYD